MQSLRAICIELYNYRFYFLNTLVYVLIIDLEDMEDRDETSVV